MKCRILKSGNCNINQKYSNSHKGIDIVALINNRSSVDTVLAHTDGEVIDIKTGTKNKRGATGMASYGNYIQIEHANGYTTFYAHLSEVYVKIGQIVKKGEEIGYMGDSGNATGIHLHFEIRKNKTYESNINPINYLNSALPGINKRSVSYRVYSNTSKKWLSTVKDGITSGNVNNLIGGIQVRTINGGSTKYRAHIKNGKWLPWIYKYGIKNYDEYAGIYGKEIDQIQIKIK